MNRLFVSAIFMALCVASSVQAEPLACLDKTPCPEGRKPPSCCDKPPCEFREQIRTKTAMRDVFSNKEVRGIFKRQAGGDNRKAALKLYEYAMKKSKDLGKTIKCKWDFNKFPPTFETNGDCDIVAKMPKGDQRMTKEEALNKIETCTEFIEAIYIHEGFHKEICDKLTSEQKANRVNQGIEDYAREERRGYTKEINYLKAQRQSWWAACSTNYKPAKSKSAKPGIDALKKNTKNKDSAGKKPKIGK